MLKLSTVSLILVLGATGLRAQLPTTAGTDSFPAAASLTIEFGGATNCAVLVTGPCVVQRATPVLSGSTNTIAATIVSLDLTGSDPVWGEVRLTAGSNLVGQASTGQILTTNNLYPATSFYDVFAQIAVGGSNYLNQTAVRLTTSVSQNPPIGSTFTNVFPVALVDAADTNTTVGTLVQLWWLPSTTGRETRLGFSVDVTGTNTYSSLTAGVCVEPSLPAATFRIRRNEFGGAITPQIGCDELTDTNLLFAAMLDTDLRAPDWRGHHKGNFIFYRLDPPGQTNLVAHGRMEGTHGVGTHRAPLSATAEDCSSCRHFEGRLRGKIVEKGHPLNGARLEATYAGEYLDDQGDPVACCPPPARPPSGPFRLTIDGVAAQRRCLEP